ncbi:MAG: hypothetical protein MI757_02540 [Pirellulales bacterium]|nr:hypothetical protein [Pirellulales bacterium]
MRRPQTLLALFVTLSCVLSASGLCQEPVALDVRYGYKVDGEQYPQTSPKEALASVIKAIESGNITYMLAHLIDPEEVDQKFKGRADQLEGLASKTTAAKRRKLAQILARHLTEGAWTLGGTTTRCETKDISDATFSRVGDRWFMQNVPGSK